MDHLQTFGVLLVMFLAASWTHAQFFCYNDRDNLCCSSTRVFGPADIEECCLGDGFYFDWAGDDTCYVCQVYGWMISGQPLDGNLTLVVEEQSAPITVQVGFTKGLGISRLLTVTDSPMTADTSDYNLLTTTSIFARPGRTKAVEFSIADDSVALEGNEIFELILQASNEFPSNEFLLDTLTIIIQDTDTVNIRFVEDDVGGSEEQGQATVRIERDSEIADSVIVRTVPMTYTDYLSRGFRPLAGIGNRAEADDFQTIPTEVIFDPLSAAIMDVVIQITQDSTNEPTEDFVVVLELVYAVIPGVAVGQMAGIVHIEDDKSIHIGFEMPNYRFVEGSGMETILVIKEDNRLSEQTFDVEILIEPANITGLDEAVQGVDFSVSITRFEFTPASQQFILDIRVFEDCDTEGPEAFKLTLDLPGGLLAVGNPSAIVVVIDNTNVLGKLLHFKARVEGSRTLTFSWEHPSVCESITSYQLSCDPQPQGFPIVINSPLIPEGVTTTLNGFSPSTTYNCSLLELDGRGPGVLASVTVTTVDDTLLFQVKITGIPDCPQWAISDVHAKLEDIRNQLQDKANALCTCGFTPQHITSEEFQCFTSSDEVTYRARLSGTALATSAEILGYLGDWISSGTASVLVQQLQLNIDSSCSLIVMDSFADPECTNGNSSSSDKNETNFIAVIIGGVLALLLIITVIVIIVILLIRWRRSISRSVHMGNSPDSFTITESQDTNVVRPHLSPSSTITTRGNVKSNNYEMVAMPNPPNGPVTTSKPHHIDSNEDFCTHSAESEDAYEVPGEVQ